MPDTASSQTENQNKETQSQPEYDSSFSQLIANAGEQGPLQPFYGFDVTHQVVQSYFENVELQVRQTRKVADLWAQSMILQQTRSEIARAVVPVVIEQIKRDPALLRQLQAK